MGGLALRRRQVHRPKGKRILAVSCAVLAGICGTRLLVAALPQMGDWMLQMTLASAAMTVPDGTAALARERFAQELLDNEIPQELEEIESSSSQASSQEPSSSQEESSQESSEPLPSIDDIPEENRGAISEVHYSAGSSSAYISTGSGFLKNSTNLSRDNVIQQLQKPLEMVIKDTDEPQVLIMHTHATESYAPYDVDFYDKSNASWRNRDNSKNVVRLGDIITQELNDAGIVTLHDATQHDYPSYNGSYERSADTVKGYLEKYPSIKVVIDVHRDAIQREDGTVIKAVSDINGEKTAQVMIIAGCDDGTMDMPNWDQNLRFAASLQDSMESAYPGLTRPIFFCYRKYNQDLTQGSLLLEFGSHGNTLEECERTAHDVGKSLAATLKKQIQ